MIEHYQKDLVIEKWTRRTVGIKQLLQKQKNYKKKNQRPKEI